MQKLNPFRSSPQSSTTPKSPVNNDSKQSSTTPKSPVNNDSKQSSTTPKSPVNNDSKQSSTTAISPVNNDSKQETCSSSSRTAEAAESSADQHTQEPGIIMGMIQKLNPFRFSSQTRSDEAVRVSTPAAPSLQKTQDHSRMPDHSPSSDAQECDEAEGHTVSTHDEDEDSLLLWWRSVEGWDEWSESKQFSEDDGDKAIEAAANRVFMAARLFVHLFDQREALLRRRIDELLALADAADSFHKKTVTASVGGGVASVAGSITTITGLVLAPFTFGTSLIVTAVGIGVATAGGVTSASANITDTLHSNTDRKKVEKMIQDYQNEIHDIKECLDFLKAGMETLQERDFEQYVDRISRKALNQNVKHVLKEGGRAGKALLVNTESLINTVQVLSVAGGAAKAVQVLSVASGVMSGLFLALDLFFLARGSMELRSGAKTEFAAKIREVCRELEDGLMELRRIQQQLQKTMSGVEEEDDEEEEEEEEEENPVVAAEDYERSRGGGGGGGGRGGESSSSCRRP